MSFGKVASGDPLAIGASWYNRLTELLNDLGDSFSSGKKISTHRPGVPFLEVQATYFSLVESEKSIGPFELVYLLKSPLASPHSWQFDNSGVMEAKCFYCYNHQLLQTEQQKHQSLRDLLFGVTLEEIHSGKVGRVCIQGIVPAFVKYNPIYHDGRLDWLNKRLASVGFKKLSDVDVERIVLDVGLTVSRYVYPPSPWWYRWFPYRILEWLYEFKDGSDPDSFRRLALGYLNQSSSTIIECCQEQAEEDEVFEPPMVDEPDGGSCSCQPPGSGPNSPPDGSGGDPSQPMPDPEVIADPDPVPDPEPDPIPGPGRPPGQPPIPAPPPDEWSVPGPPDGAPPAECFFMAQLECGRIYRPGTLEFFICVDRKMRECVREGSGIDDDIFNQTFDDEKVVKQVVETHLIAYSTLQPASLTAATTNDYSPGKASLLLLQTDMTGAKTITGLAMDQMDGQEVWIKNVSAFDDIMLAWESSLSQDRNRFNNGTVVGSDVLTPNSKVMYKWSAVVNRWIKMV
ncbi:MAG: hypothetical protein KatS3mg105_5024 [Gemmatales bacterium]|nr:MAG: hypothetical protein KatS3mg105_5024 [Gemmatales bacterium]